MVGVASTSRVSANPTVAVLRRAQFEEHDTDKVIELYQNLFENMRETVEQLEKNNFGINDCDNNNDVKDEDTKAMDSFLESAAEVITQREKLRAYKQALGVLRTSYQGIEEDDQNGTDFAELLGQYEAQQQGTTRGEYDVRSHSDFKELDSRIANLKNPDSAAHNGNGNDDDIVATQAGNALLGVTNESCPITGKALVEIDNPVIDSKGVVYEEVDIKRYIQMKSGRRSNAIVACPMAGSSHTISIESLHPATRLIRAKQRGRLRPNRNDIEAEDVEEIE